MRVYETREAWGGHTCTVRTPRGQRTDGCHGWVCKDWRIKVHFRVSGNSYKLIYESSRGGGSDALRTLELRTVLDMAETKGVEGRCTTNAVGGVRQIEHSVARGCSSKPFRKFYSISVLFALRNVCGRGVLGYESRLNTKVAQRVS